MKNLKFKVISKYLRPYKREFLYGALALLIVNILSVVIPLEVKNIIDQLQNGFSSDFVISKSFTNKHISVIQFPINVIDFRWNNIDKIIYSLPNLAIDDVPVGKDDKFDKLIKT